MNFISQICRLSWLTLATMFLVTGCVSTKKPPELWMVSQETGAVELDANANGGVDENRGGTDAVTFAASRANLNVYSTDEVDAALGLETDDQTAAEVEFTPYSTIIATDVQGAIQEALDDGGTDDQNAAEVQFTPAAGVIATDVQGAIEEVAANAGTDDQIASEVPFTPYGTIGSTNAQAAIQEALDEGGTDDQTAAEVSFLPEGSITSNTVQLAIQEVRDEATAGSGDVVGPADSVDGQVALFDGDTGILLKQSQMVEDALGNLNIPGDITTEGVIISRPDGERILFMSENTVPVAGATGQWRLYIEDGVWKFANETIEKSIAGLENPVFTGVVEGGSFLATRTSGNPSVYTWYEDPDIGNNKIDVIVPASILTDRTIDLSKMGINTIEWIFNDVGSVLTGKRIRIPAGASWNYAYSWCDVGEPALTYTLYQATSLGGTFSPIGTIVHNSAAATDSESISTFADPAEGYWVRLDITTEATTATECTLAIELLSN